VDWLEGQIDRMNAALSPLNSFVLPGGTPAAAFLHQARTVVRRAERLVVALISAPDEAVNRLVLIYLNRLSDLLFVMSRYVNGRGANDVLWVPGASR
jgi:cob(I)alamin adenosyltransferase